MATTAVLQIGLALEESPASLAAELASISSDRTSVLRLLERLISRVQHRGHKLSVRVDSAIAGSAQGVLESATPTATLSFADVAADDGFFFCSQTFTFKVSAANENEITIGANLAALTTNVVNAINAHSKLRGIFSATGNTSTGVVTLTFHGDSRMAKLMTLLSLDAGVVFSAANFEGDTTDAYAGAPVLFSDGGLL